MSLSGRTLLHPLYNEVVRVYIGFALSIGSSVPRTVSALWIVAYFMDYTVKLVKSDHYIVWSLMIDKSFYNRENKTWFCM